MIGPNNPKVPSVRALPKHAPSFKQSLKSLFWMNPAEISERTRVLDWPNDFRGCIYSVPNYCYRNLDSDTPDVFILSYRSCMQTVSSS